MEGIVFPFQLTPGFSQKPLGGPWVPEENITAPFTPEPRAGLFTLAWPPDSFTDVTYRHTGTLTQRMGQENRERTRRQGRRRRRRRRKTAK